MIKSLFLLTLFVLLSGCEEEVPMYDNLTPAEQAAIRLRATQLCEENSNAAFSAMSTASNDLMADYVRGKYWKIELKNNSNSSVISTDYIYVWKIDGTTVYFLYQKKNGTGFDYFFYKIPLSFNADMYADLKDKKCDKTYDIGNNSGAITVFKPNLASSEPPTNFKNDYTYSVKSTLPAFFSLYNFTQKKKKLDTNNNIVSTEIFTTTLTYVGVKTNLEALHTTYNPKYCIFDYDDDGAEKDLAIPYVDSSCVTSTAGPANPGADASLNFNPAVDLVIP